MAGFVSGHRRTGWQSVQCTHRSVKKVTTSSGLCVREASGTLETRACVLWRWTEPEYLEEIVEVLVQSTHGNDRGTVMSPAFEASSG